MRDAGLTVEQFKKLPEITRRKTRQAERLLAGLAPFRDRVQLPTVPVCCAPRTMLLRFTSPATALSTKSPNA